MKILVGSFQCESNSFCPAVVNETDFEVYEGASVLDRLAAVPTFELAGASVVPLLFVSALPSGPVTRAAFEHFQKRFLKLIAENLDADGVYLYLHGSMEVQGLGSGDQMFVEAVRALVGPNIPISVALDFHANLSDAFVSSVNAINGFRTAPHVDHDDTERRAARSLLSCVTQRVTPRPAIVHIPFLGGDGSVTVKEPFPRVTAMLEELDSRAEIVSAALFNAQPWYDAEFAGASAVVSSTGDVALEEALRLARVFWDGRHGLAIEGALEVHAAVTASLNADEPLVFVTDSGDNTTAGAPGTGTLLLREYLEAAAERTLVCGVQAEEVTASLVGRKPGSVHDIVLCRGKTGPQEIETRISVTFKGSGVVHGWAGDEVGRGVLVQHEGVDIVFTDARSAFTSLDHFRKMNIDPTDYRVVVLKMGYLFPLLSQISATAIFALSPGQSSNDFANFPYRRMSRRRFPICDDIRWSEIENAARPAELAHRA